MGDDVVVAGQRGRGDGLNRKGDHHKTGQESQGSTKCRGSLGFSAYSGSA